MQNRQAEQAEGKAKAMQNSIEKLQEIVDRYENLVFLAAQVFPQRAVYRIFDL